MNILLISLVFSGVSAELGQLLVGGRDNNGNRLSVQVFPPPSSNTCSIPQLPEPRTGHSISLLSGGRLVVCGGKGDVSRSCIGWQSGNTSWTHLHTLRSSFLIYYSNKQLTQQHGQSFQCGLDTIIFSQRHCTIWLAQCRNFARWRNISTASQWI